MPSYIIFIQQIIHEQELIIGPIAWEEAKKVGGLVIVNQLKGEVDVQGDGKAVLERLVAQYERLFGRASREVCRSAVRNLVNDMPAENVPEVLR